MSALPSTPGRAFKDAPVWRCGRQAQLIELCWRKKVGKGKERRRRRQSEKLQLEANYKSENAAPCADAEDGISFTERVNQITTV